MALWLKPRTSKWRSSSNSARRFSPLDIPNLIAWYRADLGITLNGSDVSAWADQSGNGNNLIQATALDQFLFNASDSNFNGEPSVTLDGVRTFMATASFTAITQPNTIILVHKAATTASLTPFYDGIAVGNRQVYTHDSTNDRLFANSVYDPFSAGADTNANIFAALFNTTASNAWKNGTPAGSTGDVGTHTMTGITLGSNFNQSNFGDGEITELAVYNRNLSTAEKNPWGNYAADRYGLTWTNI